MMMGIKNSIYLIFTLLLLLTNVYGRRSLVKQTKSSILSSFEKYIRKRLKKTDPGPNIICTKPGTKPKSLVCYNTGGEQNCVARQEAYEKYEQYKQDKAKSSGRSLYRHERRTYNINIDQMLEASRHVPPECPSPCGCWLTKVWVKEGATWDQISSRLRKWGVPEELFSQYEMATMFDEQATFINFDFYLQPNGDKAEYEVALGAARRYDGKVEIGYLYAGKASAIVSPSYSCGRAKKKKGGFFGKGGTHKYCNKKGIPPEKITAIQRALEYFAFDTIKFDGSHNHDMMMDNMMDGSTSSDKFDIDLNYDDGDDSLWELNDETRNMILGSNNQFDKNDRSFKFDQQGSNTPSRHNQLLFHHNKNCKNGKILRWAHDASERCPFDYVGSPYVAKIST
eukprot:g6258.t1